VARSRYPGMKRIPVQYQEVPLAAVSTAGGDCHAKADPSVNADRCASTIYAILYGSFHHPAKYVTIDVRRL